MPKQKVFHSLDEFHEEYLPNDILSDLEKKLCSKMGLTESHQHRLSVSKDNPRTGFIEVARPGLPHEVLLPEEYSPVAFAVAGFYKVRGFEIFKQENDLVEVGKGKERYSIMITKQINSYGVFVRETLPGI
ncbi:hypothetical protein JXB27_02190 [Candidatus Woesearchaeota archaeon]|nr:hypothetical protein [Candidatus Woesearchaeota archaeon]